MLGKPEPELVEHIRKVLKEAMLILGNPEGNRLCFLLPVCDPGATLSPLHMLQRNWSLDEADCAVLRREHSIAAVPGATQVQGIGNCASNAHSSGAAVRIQTAVLRPSSPTHASRVDNHRPRRRVCGGQFCRQGVQSRRAAQTHGRNHARRKSASERGGAARLSDDAGRRGIGRPQPFQGIILRCCLGIILVF